MILLLETIHADAHAQLVDSHEVTLVEDLSTFDPAEHNGVRAIITRGKGQVTREVIAAFPDLEVIARCGVGLDNVDTEAAAAADVLVVHAPGTLASSVVEHALMLMLAVTRRLVQVDTAVKAGNWQVRNGFEGIELAGKRLGIFGYGDIGRALGEVGRVLGMDVVCTTRRTDGVDVPRLPFDELVETSDVIQVCAPLTEQTHGIFDADAFKKMKPTAVVINTARGGLVDHDALADALDAGELGGYGADVWEPEPPTGGDRVLAHRRTVVTPHVAALTDVTYRAICVGPADSVLRVLDGKGPIPWTVFAR